MVSQIAAIELTEPEKALAERIFSPQSRESYSWAPIGAAMLALMRSLRKRKAIPEARWKYFTDPECFVGGHGRSHLQVFEKNGTYGDDIVRHEHFVKYLRYFLYGPDLPTDVIEAFRGKIVECGGDFTGSDALTVADFAGKLARSHRLAADNVGEEFFKLAIECGFDTAGARCVRDKVKTGRKRSGSK